MPLEGDLRRVLDGDEVVRLRDAQAVLAVAQVAGVVALHRGYHLVETGIVGVGGWRSYIGYQIDILTLH